MATADLSRTPVLVGAGQVTDRDSALSPLELMAAAARLAASDAGPGGERLLGRAGSVGVVDLFSWPVPDPAAVLAGTLGLHPRETVRTARGGTSPLALLADLAGAIAAGELDVALIAGGEAGTAHMRAMRTGEPTGWPEQPEGTSATRTVGADREPSHPAETAAGLIAPIFVYPLLESAVRGARGRTPAEHREVLGRLWARFASVAATNPHAWSTDPPTDPEAIATPSPANRLVAEPYTKLMTANIQVDQGAALLLCSAAEAQRAGIARERWVVVHATAAAHDHWFTGEREHLHRSPAIAACGRAALAHAGTEIDDVALLDLYSCFPAAVQIAGDALGVDPLTDPRPPTVTGGLTFAGGPANDYVTHALATMVGRLREQPGARGLCTAVGWYLTKHAVAVLGGPGAPAPGGEFAHHDVQEQVDALPRRAIAADVAATAPVEAFTALYDRDGTPTMAIVAALLDDGRRALGACHDRVAIGELLADDALGRPVRLDGAAGVTPA